MVSFVGVGVTGLGACSAALNRGASPGGSVHSDGLVRLLLEGIVDGESLPVAVGSPEMQRHDAHAACLEIHAANA